jgi:hypothetical protein
MKTKQAEPPAAKPEKKPTPKAPKRELLALEQWQKIRREHPGTTTDFLDIPLPVMERFEDLAKQFRLPKHALAAAVLDAFLDMAEGDDTVSFPLMLCQVEV